MNHKFVHLNAHSSYSLLEGIPSIKALATKAKAEGMPAIGITDTGNMFGAVDITKAFFDKGVQPIFGTQIALRRDGSTTNPDMVYLLVQNEKGWKNILKIVSNSYIDKEDHEDPQVSIDTLEKYNNGLILLTGCARKSPIARLIIEGQTDTACHKLEKLSNIFKGRTYVEIQRHGLSEEAQSEEGLLKLAYKLNLPLVATNDIRFLDKKQNGAFEVMLAIGDGTTMSDPRRRKFSSEHYFKTADEMCELFVDLPEATANTVAIAKRCAFKVTTGINYMPVWPTKDGKNVEELLALEAREGLQNRLHKFVFTVEMSDAEKAEIYQKYTDRLNFELRIIAEMGYPGYFLITSDFIRWAKAQDIPVGPGRGSGAGSLVAWVIDITDVDPIPFGLYFERFLNPDRVSLPDFDIDFCQTRRDEVITYVRDKYGEDCVTQIITFGTLKARACIRDVGRVLDMSFNQCSRIAAFIPEGAASIPIEKALSEDERLRELYEEDEDVTHLLNIAMELEGCYRHASTHAAGVHISDRPVNEIAPLYKDPRSDMLVTSFDWYNAECVGLVKFDFLGLKTLTTVKTCVDLVEKIYGKKLDVLKFPLDDPDTLALLQRGETIGVFQVESRGITELLKKIVPDKFGFLSDVIALYRPGPLGSGMVDDFIDCRHGKKEPNYPHPALKNVLEETFGVPVYQEQVMRMAQDLAGYTLAEADNLRRAMGKKKPEEMAKQRHVFVAGASKKHNVPDEQANQIFDLMEQFASYGFNKAHTVAYAMVSWQTAYLKTHYPVEFMAASMTLDRGASDKVLKFKVELDRMKINLLLPDINKSTVPFGVEEGSVRFALGAIKGAGDDAMQAIVDEREKGGKYKNIYDFMERQSPKHMSRRQLEVLIKAGAFDKLEPSRAKLFAGVDMLLSLMQTAFEEKNSNQIGLFGGEGDKNSLERPELHEVTPWDRFEKLEYEQQALGFYLSSHPLDAYKKELASKNITPVANLQSKATLDGSVVKVAGIINSKRELKTKNGNRMAILTISDSSGQEEIALFPETYDNCYNLIEKGKPLFFTLNVQMAEDRLRINAESLGDLDKVLNQQAILRITISSVKELEALQIVMDIPEKGNTVCELSYFKHGFGNVRFRLPNKVAPTKKFLARLDTLPGVSMTE